MSLINQMLKDLEQRQTVPDKSEIVLSGLDTFSDTDRAFRLPASLKLFFLFILCAGVFVLLFRYISLSPIAQNKSKKHSIEIPLTLPSITNPQNKENYLLSSSLPAALTGMTFQVENGQTSLRFLLNNTVLYRLNTLDNKLQLQLIFENTQAVANLPEINYTNSAITNIAMANLPNGSLLITLNLVPDTEIQTIELIPTGKVSEMHLNFVNKTQFKIQANDTATAMKKISVDLPMERKYHHALDLVSNEQIQEAIGELDLLLQETPSFNPARQSLAELLLQEGYEHRADMLLQEGLRKFPKHVPFIQLKARLLGQKGEVSRAITLLEKTSPVMSDYPNYYALLAAFYQQLGRNQQAVNLYKQLVQIYPQKSIWWLGLGVALDATGEHKAANEAYAKASLDASLTPSLKTYLDTHLHYNG